VATVDSLATDVQNWVFAGVTGSATVLSATQCGEFINTAIRRLQRHHRWQFQITKTVLTIPGQTVASVTLPSDFVVELAVASIDTSQSAPSSSYVPIQKCLEWQWFDAVDPLATRDPQYPAIMATLNLTLAQDRRYYFLVNDQLWIVPTPSSAITVLLEYERTLADLVTGQSPAMSNAFTLRYPDVVRAGAIVEAAAYLQDQQQTAVWDAIFGKRLEEAVRHDNAVASGGQGGSRGK